LVKLLVLRLHCIVLETLLANLADRNGSSLSVICRNYQNCLVAALSEIVKAETKIMSSQSHTI